MLEVILPIILVIVTTMWASVMFILANLDMFVKEDGVMDKNIIKVTPNKDGKIFITLYGTKYEIIIDKPAKAKAETKVEK